MNKVPEQELIDLMTSEEIFLLKCIDRIYVVTDDRTSRFDSLTERYEYLSMLEKRSKEANDYDYLVRVLNKTKKMIMKYEPEYFDWWVMLCIERNLWTMIKHFRNIKLISRLLVSIDQHERLVKN